MKTKKNTKREIEFNKFDFLIGILISLLILLISIKTVSVDRGFYNTQFSKLGVFESFQERNISRVDVISNSTTLINYIANRNNVKNLDNTFFNDKEKSHMVDVKQIFDNINIGIMILFSSILLLMIFVYKKNIQKIYKSYILSFISSFILFMVFLIGLLNFKSFFRMFHLVSFNNDNWLLNPETDLMIVLFPIDFFKNSFFRIITYMLIITFLFFISGFLMRLQNRKIARYEKEMKININKKYKNR